VHKSIYVYKVLALTVKLFGCALLQKLFVRWTEIEKFWNYHIEKRVPLLLGFFFRFLNYYYYFGALVFKCGAGVGCMNYCIIYIDINRLFFVLLFDRKKNIRLCLLRRIRSTSHLR
jgi:hypothetical protein